MANVKISQLTAKGSKIAVTDRVAIAQDDGGGTFSSKYVTGEQLFGYKKYTALLTQTGTNAPTADILENSLGGTVVWTRSSAGNYFGTLTGAFLANKTFVIYQANYSTGGDYISGIFRSDNDKIAIQTRDSGGNGIDDYLDYTSIEIRVYP